MDDAQLRDYYAKRAAEYERIYRTPHRQPDLAKLREHLRTLLNGRHVLEVACGTGYWTAAIADVAAAITATDTNEETLAIARLKSLDPARVSFTRADAWHASEIHGRFDAGLAAFWWSHIPRHKLPAFFAEFHAALQPGARVVLIDNRFVPGSNTPLSRTDEAGNTYQLRHLDSGAIYEILKNFPTRAELVAAVEPYSRDVEIIEWTYFWCLKYELKSGRAPEITN